MEAPLNSADVVNVLRVSKERDRLLKQHKSLKPYLSTIVGARKRVEKIPKLPDLYHHERILISSLIKSFGRFEMEMKARIKQYRNRRGSKKIDPSVGLILLKCLYDNRSKRKLSKVMTELRTIFTNASASSADYLDSFRLPAASNEDDWAKNLIKGLEERMLECSPFCDQHKLKSKKNLRDYIKSLSDEETWHISINISYVEKSAASIKSPRAPVIEAKEKTDGKSNDDLFLD